MTTKVDWVGLFDEDSRAGFVETLRELDFAAIKNQPPPKRSGLPVGLEHVVLMNHLRGESCHLLPSGFAPIYRARLDERQRHCFSAFVGGEPLVERAWHDLIGRETTDVWLDRGLLSSNAPRTLTCNFRVISVGRITLVIDSPTTRFAGRVHGGGDSNNMSRYMARADAPRRGRFLDVGTGSGVILIHTGLFGTYDELIGADINPRAVAVARINGLLNDFGSCRFVERDIFAPEHGLGRFDLVTWNTPLRFFPEDYKPQNLDGFGGDMGIEIGMRFTRVLPSLLAEDGVGFLCMLGPVLESGERVLDEALKRDMADVGLDVTIDVQNRLWDAQLRDFHGQFGISHFEMSYLRLTRGSGRVARKEPPVRAWPTDARRWAAFQARRVGVLPTPPRPVNE